MLLVLDNFEHVLAAAGEVADVLDASPRVACHRDQPGAAPIPASRSSRSRPWARTAPRLFVERARGRPPGWEPGADGAVVDEICALLDGLPLGIELAAARVAMLPLTAIRDRLAAHLPLPGSGPRDVPERQRTLEARSPGATTSSSPELAACPARPGGLRWRVRPTTRPPCRRAADDGVDVLDQLATLADQSLIERDASMAGAGIRFRLLETIRGFALERLRDDGREEAARRRHAVAYLALAEAAAQPCRGRTSRAGWTD